MDKILEGDVHAPPSKALNYGTAGFRTQAVLMEAAMYRCGVLASLRSMQREGAFTGLMITASHNAEPDNGAKIADYHGGMLERTWEPYAEALINASTSEAVKATIQDILQKEGFTLGASTARVVVGFDTRPSSKGLHACACAGIAALGGTVVDLGEVTTPQLHFAVQHANQKSISDAAMLSEAYYNTICSGYVALKATAASPMVDKVVIDCANGVGSVALKKFPPIVAETDLEKMLQMELRNEAYSGPVNEGCGAELVQKERRPCCNVSAEKDEGRLLCSYDGDADRVVFHQFVQGEWVLYDGDKIAILIGKLLQQELEAANLTREVSFGVVQTAYANGASTDCLRSMNAPVVMAKTGVKYLHHKAEQYDVGLYFEANGHGTVLYSDKFFGLLKQSTKEEGTRAGLAYRRLSALTQVVNQATGDAISDMLVVLACLNILECDWRALYTDLPSRQMKLPVANKSSIVCSEDETSVVEPKALQEELDTCMKEVENGRCFVRPSGTEDIVRIYAEAKTEELARQLADRAAETTLKFCS